MEDWYKLSYWRAAFFVEEHGIPPYDELIVVAHRDRVNYPSLRLYRVIASDK